MAQGSLKFLTTALMLTGTTAFADIAEYNSELHIGFLNVNEWNTPLSGNDEGENQRLSFGIYESIEVASGTRLFGHVYSRERASTRTNASIGIEQDLDGLGANGLSVFASYGGLDLQAIAFDGVVRSAHAAGNRMQLTFLEDLEEVDYGALLPFDRTNQVFVGADYDVGNLSFSASVSHQYLVGSGDDRVASFAAMYVADTGWHAGLLASRYERYESGVQTQKRNTGILTVGYRNDRFAVFTDVGQRNLETATQDRKDDVFALAVEVYANDFTIAVAYGESEEGGGTESLIGSVSYEVREDFDVYFGGFDGGRADGRGETGIMAGFTLGL